MSAFVKTTLVANDLARVKSGATPTRRFGGMAVEAPPAEVLSLLGSSIVSVLYKKTGMWRKAWERVHPC